MILMLKTDETAESHEGGGYGKESLTRTAEVPLMIDRETKKVSGEGISSKIPPINTMKAQGYGGRSWGHSAPPVVHEKVTVTGTLTDNDTLLKLTVQITSIEGTAPAGVTVVVEGKTFKFNGPANMKTDEKIEVEILYQADAGKVVPVHETYPGVVLNGTHTFKLVPPGAPAQ